LAGGGKERRKKGNKQGQVTGKRERKNGGVCFNKQLFGGYTLVTAQECTGDKEKGLSGDTQGKTELGPKGREGGSV